METKDVFCDIYCNRWYDTHMCSEEGFKALIGCDIKNIIDEFDDDDEEADPVTKFPCDKCDERFDNIENLNIHFTKITLLTKQLNVALMNVNFSQRK